MRPKVVQISGLGKYVNITVEVSELKVGLFQPQLLHGEARTEILGWSGSSKIVSVAAEPRSPYTHRGVVIFLRSCNAAARQ